MNTLKYALTALIIVAISFGILYAVLTGILVFTSKVLVTIVILVVAALIWATMK